MAVYPAQNPGVYPTDFGTDVGQFRALTGDTTSTPYDPVEAGFQNYTYWSDDEIEAFLAQADDDLNYAAGLAYTSLAATAAINSTKIQDFDLQVDNTKRASDLLAMAQRFFDLSDASSEDSFVITRTGKRCHCCTPFDGELAGWSCYCGDCEYC